VGAWKITDSPHEGNKMKRRCFFDFIIKSSMVFFSAISGLSIKDAHSQSSKKIKDEYFKLSMHNPDLIDQYEKILYAHRDNAIIGDILFEKINLVDFFQVIEIINREIFNCLTQINGYYALIRDGQNSLALESLGELLNMDNFLTFYGFIYMDKVDILYCMASEYRLEATMSNPYDSYHNGIRKFNILSVDDNILILDKNKRQELCKLWYDNYNDRMGSSLDRSILFSLVSRFSNVSSRCGASKDFMIENSNVFDVLSERISYTERQKILAPLSKENLRKINFNGKLLNAQTTKTHYGEFAVTQSRFLDESTGKYGKIASFSNEKGETDYVFV
jgi:hypothetical protein